MGHYGATISCVDGRWLPRTMELAQQVLRKPHIDFHTRPGSTRRVRPDCPITNDWLHNFAFVSLGLHGAQDLLVVKHWDCGDHGGSHSFSGPEEELETYLTDLRRVRDVLREEINIAVTRLLEVDPAEPVQNNLRTLQEHGLKIRYAVLCPKDLTVHSPQPEDCYPLMFE